MTISNSGGELLTDRRDCAGVLVGGAEADDHQGVTQGEVVLFRHGRQRWGAQGRRDQRTRVVGQAGTTSRIRVEGRDRVVDAPEEQSEVHLRSDRVQRELELGHDAEVAATPADRPEQVGVFVGRRVDTAAVGQYDVGGHEVVAAQPVLLGQPAHAAAEGEPGDAGVADRSPGHGEPVGLGGAVHVSPGRASADDRAVDAPGRPGPRASRSGRS